MEVTILGSGTNLHPRRAGAGYLVRTDRPFLMDFGPRTLSNLLKTTADRHKIQHLLFTHYHADHFADFIPFFFDAVCHSKFGGHREDLTIIGPAGTKALFGMMLRVFPSFGDGRFRVRLKEVYRDPFQIGKTRITPVPVSHTNSQVCLGYRIAYHGRTLGYSGDAMYDPSLIRLCRHADVAILDCSFPKDRPGAAHMHAGECGKVAREAGVKRLVLSHLYPAADRRNVKLQAARNFGGHIVVAKDRMTIRIGP